MRALAIAWLLGGCGSAPPPCARSAGGRLPDEVRHGEADVLHIPPFEPAWIAAEAPGARLAVLGAVRASIGGDHATFAEDAFAEEIESVFECDEGWAFRARDGAIASCRAFTGTLERRDEAFLATCHPKTASRADDGAEIVEALLAERPAWRIAARDAFFPFAGGLLVLVDDAWQVRSEDDGSLVSALDDRFEPCFPTRWGDALAMTCGEDGAKTIERTRDGTTFDRVDVPHGVDPFFLSDDGEGAWSLDACPRTDESDLLHHYCARDRGRWKDVALEAGWLHELHAMHGPFVAGRETPFEIVGTRETRATGPTRPYLVDVRTGDRCDLGSAGLEGCTVGELRWTPDGVLYGPMRCRGADGWAKGRPDEGLAKISLPDGARDLRFVDTDRGIAVGENAAQIWRTIDGGRTWSRLDPGVDGDASRIDLGTRIHDGDPTPVSPIECWESRCLVGERILVQGWDSARLGPGRVLAAP